MISGLVGGVLSEWVTAGAPVESERSRQSERQYEKKACRSIDSVMIEGIANEDDGRGSVDPSSS